MTAWGHADVMMPQPDPAPPGSPFWHDPVSVRWFQVGCCGTPLFAAIGMLLVIRGFVGQKSGVPDGERKRLRYKPKTDRSES
jgi:hypothetical protein